VKFISKRVYRVVGCYGDSVMYSGCCSISSLDCISGSGSTTGCWQKTVWRSLMGMTSMIQLNV